MTWLVIAIVVILIALIVFGAWKLTQNASSFAAGAGINLVGGALVGAAAIFALTYALQDNSRPEPTQQDPQSSLLDRVEYGAR